ncbi:MAG: PD40 domain-containing protein [Melioribacteraceae bacterium]|nr:PD40 domain-containing protein [Melioribacteraceae bacterium]
MKKILLILLLFTLAKINAQFTDFHPELEWYTIEGEHVVVHFHSEAERTARTTLKIADELWDPICNLYQYEPDKVHFVIKDIDDYSNGASFFFDNKIEIWSSALDFDLRGTHNWLRNVITHEFTHMVQIQASMKVGRMVPALYLQFLNYEDKRRPDILYGFPNFIASYPVATFNIPAWFAEGTAQFQRREFNYDNWDSHRDMILRSYALDDKMLTWNQMGVFGKTSLGNESVYNSGFALTLYIGQKYGDDKIRLISERLGAVQNFTIDAAFKDVLGKGGNEIYDEWSSYLKQNYSERTSSIRENLVEGKKIADVGFGNFNPRFSKDGTKFLYISNKKADYMGLTGLYEHDLATGEEKMLVNYVRSTADYIPGTNKIIYAQMGDDNEGWANINDLYVYDKDTDESERLTHGLRANNPSVSNDGKNIVFVYQKDGTTNIGMVDIDGKNFKRLTFFENGEQAYNPKFTEDDQYIYFGQSDRGSRDLARVKTDGSGFEFIMQKNYDERNAQILSDGKIVYSSDETGIYNLYLFDPETKTSEKITNVLGGVFMSSVNNNGDIVYAGYTSDGYKIFKLENKDRIKVDSTKSYIRLNNPPLDTHTSLPDIANYDVEYLKNYDDHKLPDIEKKKYKGAFSRITVLPFLRWDNYNTSNRGIDKLKPGVYLASNDLLNRVGFFVGASINRNMERDIFATFEYKSKLPLLYDLGIKPEVSLELYSISRKSDADIGWNADTLANNTVRYDYMINTDVKYDLFEVDAVFKHRIFVRGMDLEFRYIYSQYTSTIESFTVPNTTSLYPSTSDTYLKSNNFQLKLNLDMKLPYLDSDINPIGREVQIQYNYEMNKFNDEGNYEVVDGMLKPKYNNFNFHRLELNWKEHIYLTKSHTLTAQFRGASILGDEVPDFFDFYLGGLIGMKSYPFYAISGNKLGWLNLTYRFPVFKNIDTRLGQLYIDKIFLSVHGDYGNAWTGSDIDFADFKKGAGAELRIKMTSFYLFPTSVFFNASYSFDRVNRYIDFSDEWVHYGKEWRFYGGILFDFGF